MPALKNAKWEKFAQEYAKNPNATEAYKKAGYKAKSEAGIAASASTLLKNPKVRLRLQELGAEAHTAAIMSIQEIQEFFSRVAQGDLEEETVTPSGKIVKRKVSPKDRLKAAENLTKMLGGFDNTQRVTLEIPQFVGDDEIAD